MIEDFSLQIKEGTKKSHSAAENTKFVSSFLKGVVSRENYAKLTTNFYFVYRCIEEEVDKLKTSNQCVGMIENKMLNRAPSLAKDLEYFYGNDWSKFVTPTDACQQYVNRIREVAASEPELLVAHHYTRYMGDLSGGQILKQIAKNALNLDDINGLNFYEFEDIQDTKGFKIQYRAILDNLPIDQHQANAIITEANYAFRLNMYMFDELQGNEFNSFIKMVCGFIRANTNNWKRGE